MKEPNPQKTNLKAKRTFIKKGTCSRTFFHILSREFGFPHEEAEQAADPLAGGILQQGYQCGMLWGASLAVGAEAYRRCENLDQAIALSVRATQYVMKSFVSRTDSADCEEITNTDFSNKWSSAKYMLSGSFVNCFILAGKWAPEAIESAIEGLSIDHANLPKHSMSCASEVAHKMGATDEEIVMVAGFAGGLGLSGNACGALAAAIWMNTLGRIRKQGEKISYTDPIAEKIVTAFYESTEYEMLCSKVTGLDFDTIDDHTKFLQNGGCSELINLLVEKASVQ